ncbi:MAG: hypothetical protein AAF623_10080, partial [Planctomycetota bacterium]
MRLRQSENKTGQVFEAVEQVRKEIHRKRPDLKALDRRVHYAEKFLHQLEGVQGSLAEQLRSKVQEFIQNPEDKIYVAHFCLDKNERPGSKRVMLIFADPSKSEGSCFELLIYQKLQVPEWAGRILQQSIACPIVVSRCSGGFNNETMLGIFPEHLSDKKQDHQQRSDANEFYLIDRFVARFLKYSRLSLGCFTEDSFP